MSRTVEALTAVKLVSFKGRVLGARWRRSKSRRKKALMRVLSFTFLSTRTFDFYSLMAWPSIWLLHSFNLLQLIPRYGPSSVVFCIPSPKTHFPTQADDFPSTSGICPIFFMLRISSTLWLFISYLECLLIWLNRNDSKSRGDWTTIIC